MPERTALDLLALEIRATRNLIRNMLDTRADHPTYGVTKADLQQRLNFLRGLLAAHHIIRTNDTSALWLDLTEAEAASQFCFDLSLLAKRIKEA